MTIRSLSRRINRLEGSPKRYLWIIDMGRFPGLSKDDAVIAFGNGKLPGNDDVVVFSDEHDADDPLAIMEHADLVLFGDPAGRTFGQVVVEAVQNSPESRLDSLLKTC